MISFYIKTFGCRLNIAESESIAYKLKELGLNETYDKSKASFFIVNSCTVTSNADKKVKNFVNSLKKLRKTIFIIGCGNYENDPENKIFFIDNQKKGNILEVIKKYYIKNENFNLNINIEELNKSNQFFEPSYKNIYHTRAFLKIQDGCDQDCTYCKVRFVRGKAISLDINKIIEYIAKLIDNGFKEVVLTGINLSSYNFIQDGKIINFSELLENLLKNFEGKIIFNLSSLEVNYLDDKFFELITNESIKPYFHLPLQSGSDRILKLMKRNYDLNYFNKTIEKIFRYKNFPFISTDIIVGFPSENDDDFIKTYNFCEDIQFAFMHIFPFSFREGTYAYENFQEYKVEEKVIEKRKNELENLNYKLNKSYIESLIQNKIKGYNRILIEDIFIENNRIKIVGTNYFNIKCIIEKKVHNDSINNFFNKNGEKQLNKVNYINLENMHIKINDYFEKNDLNFSFKRDLKEKKGILYASWD